MRDYYAEFLANDFYLESSENQLTKLTEAPVEVVSIPSVSYVSSLSKELVKKDTNVADENEREIIITTVQEYLQSGTVPISENKVVEAYTAKLEIVRADPELTEVFIDICEERKAILIIDGGMSEADAENHVSNLQFLTEALIMT